MSEKELEVFLDISRSPSPSDLDFALQYANAERKVRVYYSTEWSKHGTPEYEKKLKQRVGFIRDFKSALTDIYKEEEINEILSYSNPNDDAFVAMTLFDVHFRMFRRVRNAYLPAITTLITGNINKDGKLTNVLDSTHTLFDGQGERDAVSQIEQSFGIKPTE